MFLEAAKIIGTVTHYSQPGQDILYQPVTGCNGCGWFCERLPSSSYCQLCQFSEYDGYSRGKYVGNRLCYRRVTGSGKGSKCYPDAATTTNRRILGGWSFRYLIHYFRLSDGS